MKTLCLTAAVAATLGGVSAQQPRAVPAGENQLMPPSTPLIACDPYFSVWSPGDRLTEVDTTHWTGRRHELVSLVKVDGKTYRVMGRSPAVVPVMEQTALEVLPTRTVYTFEGAGVALDLSFMTPALPEDMALLSRPVTYLSYDFRSTDGREHEVAVCFAASAELTVDRVEQAVTWESGAMEGLSVVKIGSKDQQVLAKKGDDLRIDWGHLYLAAPQASTAGTGFARPGELGYAFAAGGLTGAKDAGESARADSVAGGLELRPLTVGEQGASTWLMVAYDDLFSIQYNRKNLRPYWRRDGWGAAELLEASAREYDALRKRCEAFDAELMADLEAMGGEQYAKLCALAYRQCFAAGKFVADDNGQPLQFSKENHSNGCIATSDVFYPMAPQFLLMGPTVAKSFLVPFLEYAMSERWKFPFAPHDLGTYPHANGQVYGGGEKSEENQMPVEECGNLLTLMAAVAEMEGNADFSVRYWDKLEQWAEYLKKEGFDPPNQLCTDDFAGHMAHNVNLSAKAICGIGAFGKLCRMRGMVGKAAEYERTAGEFAKRWVKEAADGDHYRLAFDRPGTWSQKYNLVWDRILGLGLFPDEVLETEMAYYRRVQNEYGLPLDNRAEYTKLDWILWTATLTRDRDDFEALVAPVFKFLNETPDRSPMTDWYQTKTARKVGFTARPVVGGVFLQALYDKGVWEKYAKRDRTGAADWAPMPEYIPPVVTPVLAAADTRPGERWAYTLQRPADGWEAAEFDDASWRRGRAGFGTPGTPGAVNGTRWNSDEIWLRREFEMPSVPTGDLMLWIHHDEEAEVYLNGVLAASTGGFTSTYETVAMTDAAKATLRPGRNTIAVHCRQSQGGQYIDVGIVDVKPGEKK